MSPSLCLNFLRKFFDFHELGIELVKTHLLFDIFRIFFEIFKVEVKEVVFLLQYKVFDLFVGTSILSRMLTQLFSQFIEINRIFIVFGNSTTVNLFFTFVFGLLQFGAVYEFGTLRRDNILKAKAHRWKNSQFFIFEVRLDIEEIY